MKHDSCLALAIALLLAVVVRASASPGTFEDLLRDDGVVSDQQPTRYGGPSADTLTLDKSGFEIWEQAADNTLMSRPQEESL